MTGAAGLRARVAAGTRALHEGERRLGERLEDLRSRLWRSPYWLRTLRAAGLSPRDLQRPSDLAGFPLLDRATLARRWRALPIVEDGAELVTTRSSGSTGAPITVVRDRYDEAHMWAVLRFFVERLDVKLPARPRVALLDSLPGGFELRARAPLFHDGSLHRIWIWGVRPAARLARLAPALLASDPAGLHWLAARSPPPPAPRLIVTSAQRFAPEQRAALAAAVAAPVVNYYSTTETGAVAWECPRALEVFHVLVPDVWVESVAGEIVVTRLRPSALPLLRYRTGDAGEVRAHACACGRRGPAIFGFRGRRACDFVTPAGARVDAWRLAPLFRPFPLARFRLTQRAPRAFELELAGRAAVAGRLADALRRLGWDHPVITQRPPAFDALAKPEPFRCLLTEAAAGTGRR